ncbi:MAG: acyl-CoA/acyl-ACP dehydrogenase [Microbacterium ginsengisoli]|uniref:acyl-CoA dehydrogenase family protein n=1 Tax=Microbacterium TaxID=33882 RepID=UPI0006F9C3F2|nr:MULTISPECIES: acyl-CoA dehydrogenase family protein [unclassified Microbacterium]KQR90656.1 acyl-CoA dehydrogenase [Microbacterium sp. Leaf351]KQR96850.1 acyl-CoA dehydrogenase [Microbacterium sp. Leaf347]MBN9199426.1 acyl-CoA/acyl-ACP dehydrogenase [Microbacterium ginsengisoli]OJU78607.1 MAG: acyl-CoA dehydrogenase [Microbacterium sp. 71-23]
MTFDAAAWLPDDLIERIRGRAAQVDHDNVFPQEDLDELAAAGYLSILVPSALGGGGLGLAEASLLQQRLATAAPATALAINMHLVWTGVAKVLADRGIDDLRFVQEGAVRGEVFAFGISEAGNDLVLFGSDTVAEPLADGGYAFTGTKIFTSLAAVWTNLGLHGLDTTSADAPQLVYAFVPRSDAVVTRDDWDTVGMRGTQSRTTELHSAVAPADRVVRRVAPGPNPDPIVFGIFSVFEILLGSVYTGLARRALDLAVATAKTRTSKKSGTTYAQDPDIRWRIADMGLRYDALPTELASIARDVDANAPHGPRWFTLLSGVKHRAVVMAKSVVDDAILVAGGSSYFTRSELGRLYRDVLAGQFHPSDPESAHATAASAWLGPLES